MTFIFMKNKCTKEKGYVSNYYVAESGTLDCFPSVQSCDFIGDKGTLRWFFSSIGRGRAECFLQEECNIAGSYLIRLNCALIPTIVTNL